MAKKSASMACKGLPVWFGILVLLIGLWFMAGDLALIPTFGLTLWPIVVALFGLKMWVCNK